MKHIIIALVILSSYACKQSKILTYQQGLANCKLEWAEKKKENFKDFSSMNNCLIGAQIPNFLATTIEGKHLTKPQLMGKITILNFWFIGCAPCEAEIPGFNAIAEKYGTDKINYIAIGKDDTFDIKEFLEEHPWNFEHIADGEALIKSNFKLSSGYPTTFILNKKGKIIAAFNGGKADERAVEEIQQNIIPILDKALKRNR